MNHDPFEMFGLEGEAAIVTGGQGLLGSQYVKTLSEAGAAVASFDISEKLNPILAKLAEAGHKILPLKVDITKKSEVEDAVARVESELGTPAILINNAGFSAVPNVAASQDGPFENYPEDAWDGMIDSHLKGMFLVSQAVIRAMKRAGKSGSIINISSTYGLVSPDQSLYDFRRRAGEEYYKPVGYSVAKSGVLNFTRWLAEYGGPFGIRVNTLAPGGVETSDHHPEFVKGYRQRTILGRMAKPEDYNGAILFLASPASSYMTGANLVVDGGWTAR